MHEPTASSLGNAKNDKSDNSEQIVAVPVVQHNISTNVMHENDFRYPVEDVK